MLMVGTFWLIYYSAKEDDEMSDFAVVMAVLTILIVGTQLKSLELIYAAHPQLRELNR